MRAVVQRVGRAAVRCNGETAGEIGPGLLVLLGIARRDGEAEIDWLSGRLANLRLFPDGEGNLNRSVLDTGGEILVVSNFTVLGDCRKGRRPNFLASAPPEEAEPLYEGFLDRLRKEGIPVAAGRFREIMHVEIENDGPVTVVVDTPERG